MAWADSIWIDFEKEKNKHVDYVDSINEIIADWNYIKNTYFPLMLATIDSVQIAKKEILREFLQGELETKGGIIKSGNITIAPVWVNNTVKTIL